MLDGRIKELIAIGAAVSVSCHKCAKYHIMKAREMEIDEGEIRQAVDVGMTIRKSAADQMNDLLEELSK